MAELFLFADVVVLWCPEKYCYPQQVVQLLPVLFVLVINLLIQSLKV